MRSASEFGRDHGLIHEVVVTGRTAGWGEWEWAKLAHNVQLMRQVRTLLRGDTELRIVNRRIDCGKAPFVPPGWMCLSHKIGTVLRWDAITLDLVVRDTERASNGMIEADLRSEPTANANVLDYLLEFPHLIPDAWRHGGSIGRVLFWGTIYKNPQGQRCIRMLDPIRPTWETCVVQNTDDWVPEQYPAAVIRQ